MTLTKGIRYAVITLLLIVLLLVGLIGSLMTQKGLHFALYQATRWVPGLQIAQVQGSWRDLTLKNVGYQMPGVTVKLAELHLSLDVHCLKHLSLCVNALTTSGVDVDVDTAALPPSESEPDTADDKPLSAITTPYPIELRLLKVNNLNVRVDGTAIALAEFRTAAHWQGKTLTIQPSHLQSLKVVQPKPPVEEKKGELSKQVSDKFAQDKAKRKIGKRQPAESIAQEKPLGERLSALFSQPLLPDLPKLQLPLEINVKRLSGDDIQIAGDNQITINHILLRAVAMDSQVRLNTLIVRSPQGNISATGYLQPDKQWPLDLVLNGDVNVAPLKGERLKITAQGNVRDVLSIKANLSGPFKATLAIETELAKAGLPINVALDSPTLQWPLAKQPDYQAKSLRLRLNGSVRNYVLSMRSDIRGRDIPAMQLLFDGKGNEQQFTLQRLRVATLQGHADLNAVLDWRNALSWKGQLRLDGINTAKQWPAWPANLNGKIDTQGSLYGGNWQLALPTLQLDGTVKQNPLNLRGSLSGNQSGQWKIPQLHLSLGQNKIDIRGELSDKLSLDANINAPRLDGNLPGLAGSAKGMIKLRGDSKAPQLLADLTASGLRWQDIALQQLNIKGDIHANQQVEGQLDLQLKGFKQGDMLIHSLSLIAKGSEKQHQLNLTMEGKPFAGQLALSGQFDRNSERWQGRLSNTQFNTPVGEVRLLNTVALDYLHNKQKISIGPHCWRNPNAEVCVPKTLEIGADGEASIDLKRLDLAIAKPFLPKDTALQGVFTGRADVHWQANSDLPQGKLSLIGNGVKITQNVQGHRLPIAFNTLNLNANIDHAQAQLEWLLRIAGNGEFDGNVVVSDPHNRRGLSGNVNIKQLSLAMFNPILAQGEKVQGMLNAALRLGGSVQRPEVFGQLTLDKADFDAQFMPFDITEGRLALQFAGMSSILDGVIKTSKGQISLSGDADWHNLDAWRAKIAAKGKRIRITIPPAVRLDASPDVVLEASPQALALQGSIDIPWARITVQELPEDAVSVSSDEVMLTSEHKPVEPPSMGMAINSHLSIRLGDDVHLDAFGLKARLGGALNVIQDRHGLGLNGQVNIPRGRFHVYGQDLIVRKGEIIFSGSPEQPLLNIEAIRNPDSIEGNVIAGVRITGLADKPKLDIFSDPAMSQQEALSYLLRGQGLDASGADSNAMTSLLVGMGVAKSGKLVGKIGETFGVSNLTLDSQGVGDNSQVVVSGYVLPDLQVKYGVGVFDSLATLTLRYRLMPQLYLEAVSGLNQALDLLYQFEF